MKSNNEKRDYRKLLIPALIIGAPALLAFGCYFYNTIIRDAPATASMVSVFVSNYTLLMVNLAIVLYSDGFDVVKKKTSVFYKGVFLIFAPIFAVAVLVALACKVELSGQGGELLMLLLDNGCRQNLLIPTALSVISAYGMVLISDSAYNKRNKAKRNKNRKTH